MPPLEHGIVRNVKVAFRSFRSRSYLDDREVVDVSDSRAPVDRRAVEVIVSATEEPVRFAVDHQVSHYLHVTSRRRLREAAPFSAPAAGERTAAKQCVDSDAVVVGARWIGTGMVVLVRPRGHAGKTARQRYGRLRFDFVLCTYRQTSNT